MVKVILGSVQHETTNISWQVQPLPKNWKQSALKYLGFMKHKKTSFSGWKHMLLKDLGVLYSTNGAFKAVQLRRGANNTTTQPVSSSTGWLCRVWMFSVGFCGFSPCTPAFSHSLKTCMCLVSWQFQIAFGENGSMNGYLLLFASPMTDCWPVQGVSQVFPLLQLGQAPAPYNNPEWHKWKKVDG